MEFADKVRQAANIIDIASQYTTLRKRGRRYVGLCPFHSEKDPSFTVDDEKQLFHCFGCGMGGDIFSLVMEKENLSFPEAIKYLAQKYSIPLPQERMGSPKQLKEKEIIFKINEMALAFFKKNLFNTREGQKALTYLNKRNIPETIIQKLKIGYALNSWEALFSFFQSKGITPQLLEKAGLVIPRQKKEGFYDRFRGRIIFPIFGINGKPLAFGGRTIFDADPKYLNSPDTPVYSKGELLYGLNFSKESIREKGEVILVEGYTDFVSLFGAGILNIAASLGTSLTPHQVRLVKRFAPRIIASYDADSAGEKAAVRAISLCFENEVQVKIMNLPQDTDPDSFISKHGPEAFHRLIDTSTPGLKFMMDYHLKEGKIETPEEKSRIASLMMEEIEKIPNHVIRSEYIKEVSEYLEINEDALRRTARQKPEVEKDQKKSPFFPAEKRLLQILLEDKLIAPYVFSEMKPEDFHGLKGEPLFQALSDSFKKGRELNFHEVKEKADPALISSLSEILMETGQPPTLGEALDCLFTLRTYALEIRCKKLQAEIRKLEKEGDKEKSLSLLNQIQETKKQLTQLSERNRQELGYNNDKRDRPTLERS